MSHQDTLQHGDGSRADLAEVEPVLRMLAGEHRAGPGLPAVTLRNGSGIAGKLLPVASRGFRGSRNVSYGKKTAG
jgi:hypothetical protein